MASEEHQHHEGEGKRGANPMFPRLDASEEALDNDNSGITEIDSVCMNCYKTGKTKLLLTRIPFYRDIIISSFSCEHCHFENNGVESANKIQDRGVRYKLLVSDEKDMNREVVKSDYAIFRIPLIDFEIPPKTQKGSFTTIEGILDRVKSNLEMDMESKREQDKELADKLVSFVRQLDDLRSFKLGKFEIVLDDPSGDSFIENPHEPHKDPNMSVVFYKRNKDQNEMLGIEEDTSQEEQEAAQGETDLKDEVVQFHNNCPNCNAPCQTNMKLTDIPYFKTVIIMCTVCESCGTRSSEVKSGTGIEDKGVRYTLKVTDSSDMNRDLLKGDMATFEIPEIDFYVNSGTLGGKFTTIEGLLKDFREQLDTVSPFSSEGDSRTREKAVKMRKCLDDLERIQNGQMLDVTIILDDPSGNSYLQNVYAPEDDPNMKVEHYERNFEENELLGLNDMKTENYTAD